MVKNAIKVFITKVITNWQWKSRIFVSFFIQIAKVRGNPKY